VSSLSTLLSLAILSGCSNEERLDRVPPETSVTKVTEDQENNKTKLIFGSDDRQELTNEVLAATVGIVGKPPASLRSFPLKTFVL
jgi:uncharacterized lipoprotein YajG